MPDTGTQRFIGDAKTRRSPRNGATRQGDKITDDLEMESTPAETPMSPIPGRLIASDDDGVVVRVERATPCSGCRARALCAPTAVIDIRLPLPPSASAPSLGTEVHIEIDETRLLMAMTITHLVPVAFFLFVMMLADLAGLDDATIAMVSFSGLALGLYFLRRLARCAVFHPRPRLVSPSPSSPSPARGRGRWHLHSFTGVSHGCQHQYQHHPRARSGR
ncbi:MAG: SoxR reducing system RseC family protein [Azoarcus sp.]|nr:SoxR reducing system RseC family protein [Azoarcus sp.]